ncbi:MAG: DUF6265 family protein [Aureispira sp.]
MSRDDYISKLFIKNQDKLEQAPSADLWSKLEAELDAPAPAQRAIPVLLPRAWFGYLAAASVVLVVAVGSLKWLATDPINPTTQMAAPLALHTDVPEVAEEEGEPEPYEELPRALGNSNKINEDVNKNATLVIEEKEEEEARQQEERIVAAVQKRIETTTLQQIQVNNVDDIAMNDIVVADEAIMDDVKLELVEPLQNNHFVPSGSGGGTPQVNFYQNNQPVAPQLNYNSSSVPQVTNTNTNLAEVEEVLNRSASRADKGASKYKKQEAENAYGNVAATKTIETPTKKRATGRRRGGIVAKAKEGEKIKSPMAKAHPRLYPFGFLLGRWDDDHELEGRSYEIWNLRDENTMVGKGYKLSKDKERIFEELMRIEYRNNQIFLVMSFDENNEKVEYMLTSFGQERFVFEQKGRSKYPDKVILQQSGLQGYSVTISNSSDFLRADQQRYLEHRNRVSNVRSIRTLRQAH